MSSYDRPSPAVVSHKYRALVRHNQPAPDDKFQIVDYVLFTPEGILCDILHHLKPVTIGLPDGEVDMNLTENALINSTTKSGVVFEFIEQGYQYETYAVADYLAACARIYPHDRAEWSEAWKDVFYKSGIPS